eukprot:gnl/TRDRNA2_/TRDRNA2_93608_c0_seq1.p1 gnl/TRDRNA2_/TRDRNA2_93608_c0~~gnl/TRDRNA2_/TRDRNA2_93608_c0_seq1.p1  ORF type:complete len:408 (-),score=64.21 gnl/TRDRNA2_/TRDRNA2_93608_c0_seq1:37-1134(-)
MMLNDATHSGGWGRSLTLPAATPSVKWRSSPTKQEVESSPVLGGGNIFGAAGRTIFALNQETGEKVWTFKAKSQVVASGALGGGMFLIGSDDHHFYALDQESGKLRWKFKAGEFTGGATVHKDVVFVGAGDEQLHAYFLNGTKHFAFQATAGVASTPAANDDGVFFGDDQGVFYKVDRATGRQSWKLELNAGNIRCPPRLAPDSIYISTGDPDDTKSGEVFRLSYDGSILWRSDCEGASSKCRSCWTSPAVLDDVVVVACGLDTIQEGLVWGLEKETGAVRWKFKAGDDCQTSSPVIFADAVVLGCTDGKLYALRAADGDLRWSFQAEKGIWATVALDERGTIYMASHDGFVYALGSGGHSGEEL